MLGKNDKFAIERARRKDLKLGGKFTEKYTKKFRNCIVQTIPQRADRSAVPPDKKLVAPAAPELEPTTPTVEVIAVPMSSASSY